MVELKEMSLNMLFYYYFHLLPIDSYKASNVCSADLKVIDTYYLICSHCVRIFVNYFCSLFGFTVEFLHKTTVNVWPPAIAVFFFVTIFLFFFHLFVKAIQIDIDIDFTTFL